MTFTEAAVLVLRLVGKPLHYKDITDIAIEKSLLSHVGKSPEVTMGSRLNSLLKKPEKENPLERVKPGVFALRDWSPEQIEKGLSDRRPPLECIDEAALAAALAAHEQGGAEPAEEEVASAHLPLDELDVPADAEEQHRVELSQGASALFAAEDDDDQPIFATEEEEDSAPDGEATADKGGKRRRRRRRGRGRREEGAEDESADDLPTYTVSDAPTEELVEAEPREREREPRERERDEPAQAQFGGGGDEAVPDLARWIETTLGDSDRSRGPVPAQTVADQLRRRMKGEGQLSAGAVLAAVAADNWRATATGASPRFRVANNRIGLTAWTTDRRVEEARRGLSKALEQVKSAQVKILAEQLGRLPQRALGEVVLVLLSRMGATQVSVLKRPGAHGSELHITASLRLHGLEHSWATAKTAIVVRRDGRDVGRERVSELRGALHHYGPAGHGWLMTTGQILSGAREEAASASASPISLTGKHELAELLVEYGVLVNHVQLTVPSVDLELLDALAGR